VVGRVSSPFFVGRNEEIAAFSGALAQAREGTGTVVLIAGEAGMGKSRLISETATRAENAGMTVVVGECLPLADGELPYAPIVGALRSLTRRRQTFELDAMLSPGRAELAALMPELSLESDADLVTPAGADSQGRLFEQLLALLAAAARVSPLMLVVEDFQWADPSTADFLAFLVRAGRHEPIALVISYRSEELRRRHPRRPFLLEMERSGRAMRIELGRFTRSELREQVAGILDEAPPPGSELIDRLLVRSEGNPFFTEELLASAYDAGDPLPESLRDAMLSRVEAGSPAVRHVLRIAAVTGRNVDHALLAAVVELSDEELNRALREAVESYLLSHDSSTADYSFRHALLREAIYSDLMTGEKRALHLRLARALEEQTQLVGSRAAGAAELAHHWAAAGEWSAALPASLDTAAAAEELFALGEARLHYEHALQIWDRADPVASGVDLERVEILRRAAVAADRTGEHERAINLGREVVAQIDERNDPVRAALAHERLGRLCGEPRATEKPSRSTGAPLS
jgi:predicted ATPase